MLLSVLPGLSDAEVPALRELLARWPKLSVELRGAVLRIAGVDVPSATLPAEPRGGKS